MVNNISPPIEEQGLVPSSQLDDGYHLTAAPILRVLVPSSGPCGYCMHMVHSCELPHGARN